MNFKKFENHLMVLSASQPVSQPNNVRPGCTRCRVLKLTQNNKLLRRIYETVIPKTIFLLHHGNSFILSSLSNGMHKEFV